TFGKIKDEVWYMYDELFTGDLDYKFEKINNPEEIKTILKTFITEYYNEEDDQPTWFAKIKEMSSKLGYAAEMKEYRKNPDAYKGNVADVTTVIRVALTTRDMTPNLYDIIQLLGRERMEKRFQRFY
ncbi:MAG TPA: glutamate--tRNA ligase, partial [Tenericutes bacterium]|nr:glutamate--tRNA ligase [Mycoplasmatota bacterium]